MSTQTNAVVSNSYSGITSPQQLLDVAITGQIFQSLTQTINSDTSNGLSLKKITNLLLLFSLDEVKKLIVSSVTEIISFIKTRYKDFFISIISYGLSFNLKSIIKFLLFDIFKYILFSLKHIFCGPPKKLNQDVIETCIIQKPYVLYSLNVTDTFMQSFVSYINHYRDTCSRKVSNTKKIQIHNTESFIISEQWDTINIKYHDVNICIDTSIKLSFSQHNDKFVLKSFTNVGKNSMNVNEIICFTDLLPKSELRDKLKSFVQNLIKDNDIKVTSAEKDGFKTTLFLHEYNLSINWSSDHKLNSNKGFEYNFIMVLKKNFPNLDICVAYHEFLYFIAFMQNFSINYNKVYNYMSTYATAKGKLQLFDHVINISKEDIPIFSVITTANNYNNIYFKSIKEKLNVNVEEMKLEYQGYPLFLASCEGKMERNDKEVLVTVSKILDLDTFVLEHEEIYLANKFNEFVSVISKFNDTLDSNDTYKAKIYTISLKNNITETEEDNTEYLEYEEKKKILSECSKNDSKENESKKMESNFFLHEFLKNSIPPKKIKRQITTKKIVCDFINEKSKSFSTLYLREKDIKKLKTALNQFSNKKELLEQLGLPNKLGVLLYGEPGTGKSSTIWAIASYLQKNLYYVNLNNVETNEDLQNIFDYVYTNCVSGGIVIMEDIDAMTNIVKKRISVQNSNNNIVDEWVEVKESSMVNLVDEKKDKLSLSYFLNLLQGSLTKDNMIFIATTNHLDNIDPAFYRDGRFDVKIEMKKCDHYQIANIYKKFLDRDISPALLSKIEENKYTPANIIFHIKDYLFTENVTDEEIINELIKSNFVAF